MSIYSSVQIGVKSAGGSSAFEKPIEGSVSLSVDEGSNEITKLKYEGGSIAAIKVTIDSCPTCTLEWKVAGKCTNASTANDMEVTVKTDLTNDEITFKGILIVSPSWDSQWGFVTQYKLIQTPNADDIVKAPTVMVMSSGNILIVAVEGYSTSNYDYYFTTNGTTPTTSSTKYTGSSQTITQSCTIKAITVRKSDGKTSSVTTYTYTA